MKEKQWIEKIATDAVRAANEYGYLPSVLIAQTCQETGYGETDLSKEGIYNVVGMKKELLNDTWTSEHWGGVSYTKQTPEWHRGIKVYINDTFRVYDSYYDGLADFCQFIRDARYSRGGTYKYRDLLGGSDPYTLIEGVRSRGYCTDPRYSQSIMNIIKKHSLTQYDSTARREAAVDKPAIIDRIAENEHMVPYHNANDHEYLAIHYLGVEGENPDLYQVGSTKGYGGHFYVSKDGTCYQAAKVTDEIWHVGKGSYTYIHPDARNHNTIGIECATYKENGEWRFTQATQEACARLAAWIMSHYGIPMENLLRHGDITTKCCPAPYISPDRGGFEGKGGNWSWEQFKARVRAYMGVTEEIMMDVGGKGMIRIPKTLRRGDEGKGVFILEHFLKARGYYKGGLDDSFGPLLEDAIKKYQEDRHHQSGVCLGNSDGTPDGIVGIKTWEDLVGGFDA